MTVAEKLHIGSSARVEIENALLDVYNKYEPEICKTFDFEIDSDEYDNSLEIYFTTSLPYPYEPCKEIRDAMYSLGFDCVYWNFKEDENDEIRGWEPRHRKSGGWVPSKYGYVDERFNEEEYNKTYNYRER